MENIAQIDRWFLELGVLFLGGYFLWSIRGVLADFKDSVGELKTLIGKLFDKDSDHEKRISKLEGAHQANHGGGER